MPHGITDGPSAPHHFHADRCSLARGDRRSRQRNLYRRPRTARRDDANVAAALKEVDAIAGYLKVLGSYPVAVL